MNRNIFYDYVLKPFFFRLYPETAHELSKFLLETSQKIPFFFPFLESFTTYQSSRLNVSLLGLHFSNPVGMAAGFDKTGELYPYLSHLGFGFVEIGTVTFYEQPGNPKPRVFRIAEKEALINRMGFNNPGAENLKEIIKNQKKTVIRGINFGKSKITELEKSAEDYAKSIQLLYPYADYGVINISSPNTPGLRNLQEISLFQNLITELLSHLGGRFPIPILVKFSPDLNEKDFILLLEQCLKFPIAGVILTNTTIDKSILGKGNYEEGGLSGKPLRKKANEFTKIAYRFLQGRLPIIGVGGIDSGEAALERILSGANLIQIYTGYIFKGPFLPYEICEYLDRFLEKNKYQSIQEIVGLDA